MQRKEDEEVNIDTHYRQMRKDGKEMRNKEVGPLTRSQVARGREKRWRGRELELPSCLASWGGGGGLPVISMANSRDLAIFNVRSCRSGSGVYLFSTCQGAWKPQGAES